VKTITGLSKMNSQEEVDHKIEAIIQQMLTTARLSSSEKDTTKDLLSDLKKSIQKEKESCLNLIDDLELEEEFLKAQKNTNQSLDENQLTQMNLDIETHFSMNFDTIIKANSARILQFRPRNKDSN
jgi:3-methyladenine DNA glycosylase AlkD